MAPIKAYVDPDSVLARTAREMLEAHAGGRGPADGVTECPACGERPPCPAGRSAAEVLEAAGLAEESGLVAASRQGLGEPYGEPGSGFDFSVPNLNRPWSTSAAADSPVASVSPTSFGSADAYDAGAADPAPESALSGFRTPPAFGSPIGISTEDEPVRAEYKPRRALPEEDSPVTGPRYRDALHVGPVDLSFSAAAEPPQPTSLPAPSGLLGEHPADEPAGPRLSLSFTGGDTIPDEPSLGLSLGGAGVESPGPRVELAGPGGAELSRPAEPGSGLPSVAPTPPAVPSPPAPPAEPSLPAVSSLFSAVQPAAAEPRPQEARRPEEFQRPEEAQRPEEFQRPEEARRPQEAPPMREPSPSLPPDWHQNRPLDAPKFTPARPVPRTNGANGHGLPGPSPAGLTAPTALNAPPPPPTALNQPPQSPSASNTPPQAPAAVNPPRPASQQPPAAAVPPATGFGAQGPSGLAAPTNEPQPGAAPSNGNEPSGLLGRPAAPAPTPAPEAPAAAEPSGLGLPTGQEPSGLGQATGYSGQPPTTPTAPAMPSEHEPSGLPGRPAPGNGSVHFDAAAGPEQNGAPRAAMNRGPLEAPNMGQVNRPPAGGAAPAMPNAGPALPNSGPAAPESTPAPRAVRPKLEAPNMGQLNKPLSDRDHPNPPPQP